MRVTLNRSESLAVMRTVLTEPEAGFAIAPRGARARSAAHRSAARMRVVLAVIVKLEVDPGFEIEGVVVARIAAGAVETVVERVLQRDLHVAARPEAGPSRLVEREIVCL